MRINKKWLLLPLVIVSLIALTGCLERVELNKLGIVAGLAIDTTDEGYTLTAQILNPSAISGEAHNGLPIYNLTADGESIHEAYKKIDFLSSSALSLSHLNVIVINEDIAKAGVAPVLNFALRRDDIRPDINIVVAKDAHANDILNVVTALDMIPATQINVSSMIPTHTARLTSYNLYEVVDMVNSDAINVVLNAVSIHREEDRLGEKVERKNGTEGTTTQTGQTVDNILDITAPVQLRIEHLAVFNGDKMVGFIDDAEAQLYNMVLGDYKRYDIVTQIDEDYYTSLGVTKIKSKITTDLEHNEATIKFELSGIILENTYPVDFTNTENLDAISDYLKQEFEDDMNAFVNKVQTELKSDIFGIGGKAHTQEHKVWKEKDGYWSELFPELTIHVEVELDINSVGEIGNVTL
ncbi:MAG: Ger(x)C family spore germination protein [Turicibacter sp.]|nr:Ger(x)C family spore germination protein [Turicibacter sp.]